MSLHGLRRFRNGRIAAARWCAAALLVCTCVSSAAHAQGSGDDPGAQSPSSGTISVTGQVRAPGTYALRPAEHLSEALMRAGGLTQWAYPYGAVFLRRSVARQERAADATVLHALVARCLQQMNVSSADCPKKQVLEAAAAEAKSGDAAGRITVTADPGVLAADPDKDPLLEAGDSIFIPERPTTVMVRGAVSHPGNYPYALGKTLDDYVGLAGGATGAAATGATFVVYPDGTAKQVEPSWLYYLKAAIPPGSVIVVPGQ